MNFTNITVAKDAYISQIPYSNLNSYLSGLTENIISFLILLIMMAYFIIIYKYLNKTIDKMDYLIFVLLTLCINSLLIRNAFIYNSIIYLIFMFFFIMISFYILLKKYINIQK